MTPGGDPAPLRPRRGLVLGAGAAVGGAWTLGVLAALAETEGFDASVSDVVVGTSAGSVVAALISSRVEPELIVATLTGGDSAAAGSAAPDPVDVPDQVQRALGRLPRPAPVPGNLWLAARSVAQPHPAVGVDRRGGTHASRPGRPGARWASWWSASAARRAGPTGPAHGWSPWISTPGNGSPSAPRASRGPRCRRP